MDASFCQSGVSRAASAARGLGAEHALLVRRFALGIEPAGEAGHRRERDEGGEAGEFVAQFLDHLLDEKIAEADAGKPTLGIGDRIEDGGRRLLRRDRRACGIEDRARYVPVCRG